MGVNIIAKAKKTVPVDAEDLENKQADEPIEPKKPSRSRKAKKVEAEAAAVEAKTGVEATSVDTTTKANSKAKTEHKRVVHKKAKASEPLIEGEHAPEPEHFNDGEVFVPKYDMHSNQRYVDSTSHKTDFEKMLDELSQMSLEMLKLDLEKFTKKFGDGDEDAMAKKFEAFYGGFITNAAIELYDHGYGDAAFACLEQAQKVLTAKRKLEEQLAEAKAKQEQNAVDLSDIFGFGGGISFGGDDSDANNG